MLTAVHGLYTWSAHPPDDQSCLLNAYGQLLQELIEQQLK